MSTFKNMKIRVTSEEHNIAVQEALYKLGYEWRGSADPALYKWLVGCYGLYTDTSGKILRETVWDESAAEFAKSPEEEFVLTPQGTLMPAAEYYKQPATTEKVYAPLPLQPFQQWLGDRMRQLVEHIAHDMESSTSVDVALTRELHVLSYLVRNYEGK